jgi:hypothetical protein
MVPCNKLTEINKQFYTHTQPPSEKLRRVALVRTDVSEEPSVSIIRVTRIGELETILVSVIFSISLQLGSVASYG